MNTDAAAPVAFAAGLDLTIPHSFAIGIGLLIGGIVLIVITIVLIVLGARARPRLQSGPGPDLPAGALAGSLIARIAAAHGLRDASAFARLFKTVEGVTPREFRAGA